MSIESANFLKKKYDLHKSEEVESAANRTSKRTEEAVSQKPEARIQNYLDRFKEITNREDPAKRERGLRALKTVLYDTFVMKSGEIPPSYYNLQGEIAVREGRQADLEQAGVTITTETQQDKDGTEQEVRHFSFPPELKEQHDEAVSSNQARSLDKWVDYLASDDAQYPDWAKYWALRSVLSMGKFEKVKNDADEVTGARFGKRVLPETDPATGELTNNPTVASYPLLNPRALALTIGTMRERLEQKSKPKKERQVTNQSSKLDDSTYKQLLASEDFSKLYAQFLIELPEYSPEKLQETRGAWVTFPQSADPMSHQPSFAFEGQEYTGKPLVPSIENYPLEWCTAYPDTARTQLKGGDFHVYYSVNELDEPVIPRLAIRMEGDHIAEPPRGIAPDQNLDPHIAPVLEEKLAAFGAEGEAFKKRAEDMQRLSRIEQEMKGSTFASKDVEVRRQDLMFLYEIDASIEGFGYDRDPRIDELRQTRNSKEDAPVVLGINPDQIAWNQDEITENTKSYIGPLYPDVFQELASIDHLYTGFPEGRIRRGSVEVGTLSKEQIEDRLAQQQVYVSRWANDLLHHEKFTVAEEAEQLDLVRLTVRDLGFPDGATTEEIYQKADELGLELCPAEAGPQLRLQEDTEQRLGTYLNIAMEQIPGSNGRPDVFCLYRRADRPELDAHDARPDGWWGSGHPFVFRIRKEPLGT
ncbi:MAG: hypothetical protein QGF90_05780 [Gammaproteobacteria bacterium]|nr:hypothetical protein [Gammaproteobacteria bacterium]